MENQKGAGGHPGLGDWKEQGVLGKTKPFLLGREGSPMQSMHLHSELPAGGFFPDGATQADR